jgi:hypothetical protein
MAEASLETTDIKAQYTAQVAADLERNAKEQDRLREEIDALQNQLEALRQDHSVLLNMQEALGAATTSAPAPAAEDVAAPSVPRQKSAAKPRAAKPKAAAKKAPAGKAASPRGGKSAKDSVKRSGKDSGKAEATAPAASASASAKAAKPTLVELISRHLNEQTEPRSAAEVAAALGQAHPDRRIQTTVVRTTLESLVAKSRAQRTKQGSSVFYTAPDAQESATATGDDVQQDQAGK